MYSIFMYVVFYLVLKVVFVWYRIISLFFLVIECYLFYKDCMIERSIVIYNNYKIDDGSKTVLVYVNAHCN